MTDNGGIPRASTKDFFQGAEKLKNLEKIQDLIRDVKEIVTKGDEFYRQSIVAVGAVTEAARQVTEVFGELSKILKEKEETHDVPGRTSSGD